MQSIDETDEEEIKRVQNLKKCLGYAMIVQTNEKNLERGKKMYEILKRKVDENNRYQSALIQLRAQHNV